MKKLKKYHDPHTFGSKLLDFFAWLKGLWSPKYVPQRSRYKDRKN